MKNIFVDTNIIIDLLADRQPFSKAAIEIFEFAANKKITLFTSSHTIATSHYLLKKYMQEAELRQVIYDLTDYLRVIPIDIDIIKKSLLSKHKDFEDAIQIFAAYTEKNIDTIVTRNVKDFKNTGITVLPPDEFLLCIS